MIHVYILPLRNENTDQLGKNVGQTLSLYPTFKEWKHVKNYRAVVKTYTGLYPTFKEWKLQRTCNTPFQIPKVYILPLRNENIIHT